MQAPGNGTTTEKAPRGRQRTEQVVIEHVRYSVALSGLSIVDAFVPGIFTPVCDLSHLRCLFSKQQYTYTFSTFSILLLFLFIFLFFYFFTFLFTFLIFYFFTFSFVVFLRAKRVLTAFFSLCGTWCHRGREMALNRIAFDNQRVTKELFKTQSNESTRQARGKVKASIVFVQNLHGDSVNSPQRKSKYSVENRPALHGA
jgi:hypothetical protein